VPIVLKFGSLNFLELSGPVQACNGIALLLPLPLLTFIRFKLIKLSVFAGLLIWVVTLNVLVSRKYLHNFNALTLYVREWGKLKFDACRNMAPGQFVKKFRAFQRNLSLPFSESMQYISMDLHEHHSGNP